jgi:hypothetical protein
MTFEDLLNQANLTVAAFAPLLHRLLNSPFWRAVDCTVVIPVGATSASALHGLGRRYNGAAVVGLSAPTAVAVAPPGSGAGDPATQLTVSVASAIVGTPLTVYLKVF